VLVLAALVVVVVVGCVGIGGDGGGGVQPVVSAVAPSDFFVVENLLSEEPYGPTAHVCREGLRWLSAKRPLPAQLC
jgi:hypothetical protein